METDELTKREETGVTPKINYIALIRAYKMIKMWVGIEPENMTENLKARYDDWRNDERNMAEKCIAEMVVVHEHFNLLIHQEEIEKELGFSLFPSDDEIDDDCSMS